MCLPVGAKILTIKSSLDGILSLWTEHVIDNAKGQELRYFITAQDQVAFCSNHELQYVGTCLDLYGSALHIYEEIRK
jgi:hypothetical protein